MSKSDALALKGAFSAQGSPAGHSGGSGTSTAMSKAAGDLSKAVSVDSMKTLKDSMKTLKDSTVVSMDSSSSSMDPMTNLKDSTAVSVDSSSSSMDSSLSLKGSTLSSKDSASSPNLALAGSRGGNVPPSYQPLHPAESFWSSQGPYEDVPLTTMRKIIAARLSESKKSAPHAYCTIECGVDRILDARAQLKALGFAMIPSMNDAIVKAAALALKAVPEVNVRMEKNGIIRNESIDVSVAVATPGGLITPIVTHADRKSMVGIATAMKDLALRAKANKLKPQEFQGGSFTVSNLGMLGISNFTAIINAPQVAILAVGGGKKEIVPPANVKNSKINIPLSELTAWETKIEVALSFDRRAINEVSAARFLNAFQSFLQAPAVLFGGEE